MSEVEFHISPRSYELERVLEILAYRNDRIYYEDGGQTDVRWYVPFGDAVGIDIDTERSTITVYYYYTDYSEVNEDKVVKVATVYLDKEENDLVKQWFDNGHLEMIETFVWEELAIAQCKHETGNECYIANGPVYCEEDNTCYEAVNVIVSYDTGIDVFKRWWFESE